jgi:transcriptional regulator with XRE-family HTH domain
MSEQLIKRERVAEALDLRGKTQEWLAEQIGITTQAVGQALARGSLSLGNAVKMAQSLNVSLDWLVGLDTSPSIVGEIIDTLPAAQQQQSLDFLLYQIDRADQSVLACERAARYVAMIDRIKRDMEERRKRDE